MSSGSAELSSVAAQLDDLVVRVTSVAEDLGRTGRSDVAAELYEVERALQAAGRRLEGSRRSLDRATSAESGTGGP